MFKKLLIVAISVLMLLSASTIVYGDETSNYQDNGVYTVYSDGYMLVSNNDEDNSSTLCKSDYKTSITINNPADGLDYDVTVDYSSLKSVYVSKDVETLRDGRYALSIFYYLPSDIVIYTDATEDNIPSGWNTYWNYNKETKLKVVYGISYANYLKEIIYAIDIDVAESPTSIPMYRLYNPNGGEHFYTASEKERDNLVSLGWRDEDVAWTAPKSGEPVYRLYNSVTGNDHIYTMSETEVKNLKKAGWTYEGIAWYSADAATGTPVYRVLNPNATTGTHHYTTSFDEVKWLISLGWYYEGIGWYGE